MNNRTVTIPLNEYDALRCVDYYHWYLDCFDPLLRLLARGDLNHEEQKHLTREAKMILRNRKIAMSGLDETRLYENKLKELKNDQ